MCGLSPDTFWTHDTGHEESGVSDSADLIPDSERSVRMEFVRTEEFSPGSVGTERRERESLHFLFQN